MKRLLTVYIAILAAVFILLSLLSGRSTYQIEKRLWRVQQDYRDIVKDPTVVPDQTFDRVAASYEKIIRDYPESDLIKGVHLLVGDIWTMKKDYEKARSKYQDVVDKYSQDRNLAADASARIGRTYEKEGDWLKAKALYDEVIRQYPDTQIGLGIPIYIASKYKRENDYQKTVQAFNEAITHYQKLREQHRGTLIGFNASRSLATCYIEMTRWPEALETLSLILNEYASADFLTPQRVDTVIKTINIIAAYQLHDYDRAMDIYRTFIASHPDHPLNAYLQRMIDGFETLKEQGIRVSTDPPQN